MTSDKQYSKNAENSVVTLVSVVIVHFHSGDYIFDCLRALREQGVHEPNLLLEIIVVDNNSNDAASRKLLTMSRREEIRYYPQAENLGFTGANNIGISMSNGSFVLTLNADVFLDRFFLQRLLSVLLQDNSVGSVCGKLRSLADKTVLDSTGIVLFRDGTGIDRGFGEKDTGQYDRPQFVLGACAAAALYRRSMLEEVARAHGKADEYFNESFFAFLEDVELATLANLLGWKAFYVPGATASHVRGGSTAHVSDKVKLLKLRNERLLYYKLFGRKGVGWFSAHWLLLLLRVLTTRPKIVLSAWREYLGLKGVMDQQNAGAGHRYHYENLEPYIERSYVLRRMREKLAMAKS